MPCRVMPCHPRSVLKKPKGTCANNLFFDFSFGIHVMSCHTMPSSVRPQKTKRHLWQQQLRFCFLIFFIWHVMSRHVMSRHVMSRHVILGGVSASLSSPETVCPYVFVTFHQSFFFVVIIKTSNDPSKRCVARVAALPRFDELLEQGH